MHKNIILNKFMSNSKMAAIRDRISVNEADLYLFFDSSHSRVT